MRAICRVMLERLRDTADVTSNERQPLAVCSVEDARIVTFVQIRSLVPFL
jgi:hypothetical protein